MSMLNDRQREAVEHLEGLCSSSPVLAPERRSC
jgi:hypothetical protein